MKDKIKNLIEKAKDAVLEDSKSAEEALKESEEKYKDLYDNAPAMFVSVNNDGKVIKCNKQLIEKTGYSESEIIGHHILERYHTVDAAKKAFQSFIKTGVVENAELQLKKKNGGVIDVILNVTSVKDDKGNVLRSRSVWQDITEKKKAEEELQKSQRYLVKAQEIAKVGSWAWDKDKNESYFSEETFQMLGYAPNEIKISFEWLLEIMHPDDVDLVVKGIDKSMKTNNPYDMEYRLKRKDGKEIIVHSQGEVVLDQAGKATGMIGVIQDITERKKAEEKIKESEEKYKSLVEKMNDGLGIINTKGNITFVNKALCDMWGHPEKEIVGHNPVDFLNEENKRIFLNQLTIRKKGGSKPYEITWDVKKGKITTIIAPTPMFDYNGINIGSFAVMTDITEKKKAEENLKKSEEQYDNLFNEMTEGCALCEIILDKKQNPVDYRFLKINPAFEAHTGMSVKNSLGKTIKEIFPDIEESWIKRYGNVAITKEPLHIQDYNHNTNKWYDVTAFSTSKGKFAMIFKDITEKKKAEEEKEKLQKQLEIYAKKLEIKLKRLEKHKLTEKEKLVLWGITRYPNNKDQSLAKKLKLKRSTVTAIKNRLRDKDMYSITNVPDFKALGAELITFSYGRYGLSSEKRKELNGKKELTNHGSNYLIATDNEFIGGFISKNMAEFEKKVTPAMNIANEYNILKSYRETHFLFELNKIYRFFNYSTLLKRSFKIKIPEKAEKKEKVKIKLTNNEKKVLLTMIEYPDLSAYDLSFKINLTRATISNIKKRLIKKRLITTTIIPNTSKLNLGLLILMHTKHGHSFKEDNLKAILKSNPHIIFMIGGRKESISLSFFKNYTQYRKFKKKIPYEDKNIFREDPTVYKMLTKNTKASKFSFLDTTKKLLE